MRLYFMLRHAGYPEEKCWSDCFNCGNSCVFSLLNENTQYALYFKAIFDFVWIWILCHGSCGHLHEVIDLGFSHVAATTQKTAGHDTRNTAINESQSSRSWSLYNTQYEFKKSSHLLWLFPLNFTRQLWKTWWKTWFSPCFKGVFHKRINILDRVCFCHFISTRAENPCSQR